MRTGTSVFAIVFLVVAFAVAAFTMVAPAARQRAVAGFERARARAESARASAIEGPTRARMDLGSLDPAVSQVEIDPLPAPSVRIGPAPKIVRTYTHYGARRRSFLNDPEGWFPFVAVSLLGAALIGFVRTRVRRRTV